MQNAFAGAEVPDLGKMGASYFACLFHKTNDLRSKNKRFFQGISGAQKMRCASKSQ
jgi:hypothetical protein